VLAATVPEISSEEEFESILASGSSNSVSDQPIILIADYPILGYIDTRMLP
jgi:hypothetical protein